VNRAALVAQKSLPPWLDRQRRSGEGKRPPSLTVVYMHRFSHLVCYVRCIGCTLPHRNAEDGRHDESAEAVDSVDQSSRLRFSDSFSDKANVDLASPPTLTIRLDAVMVDVRASWSVE